MRIRVVKSETCDNCKKYLNHLEKLGFTDYDLYDADDPKNQKDLDAWGITDMPIIQIYDPETSRVHYTFPYCERGYSPRNLRYKLSVCEEIIK